MTVTLGTQPASHYSKGIWTMADTSKAVAFALVRNSERHRENWDHHVFFDMDVAREWLDTQQGAGFEYITTRVFVHDAPVDSGVEGDMDDRCSD